MSQLSLTKINLAQNSLDFILEPLEEQALLFKLQYLKKTLDLPQEDPEETQTCTIKCLVQGCR
jgi:hypothetical protein